MGRCRLLLVNLVQYVADNVLLMMLASSISLVGLSAIDKRDLHPLLIHALSLLISALIVLALRAMVLCIGGCTGRGCQAVCSHEGVAWNRLQA